MLGKGYEKILVKKLLIRTLILIGSFVEGAVNKCLKDCPSTYEPVCGTDDLTYDNECFLQVEACSQKEVSTL